jgi:chorismate-pyruvate lyase
MMSTVAAPDLLQPLAYFRHNGGRALPSFETVPGENVPQPYRDLLVHHGDMTSRLEAFHGGPIELDVLHSGHSDDVYRREVLLRVAPRGVAVEYGAIEIFLDAFEEPLRAKILEAHIPLGGLLNAFKVSYRSEPRAFIKLAPDPQMDALFGLEGAHPLYGRVNLLLTRGARELARIVEVLRP